MAALKLDVDLYRFASRHALFQVSNLAYIGVDVVRNALRRYASRTPKLSIPAEDDWVKASYAQMFAFHDEMTPEERKIWSLRQYEKYIRLIHAGAEALRIKSLFLIQPIPGWGKLPRSGKRWPLRARPGTVQRDDQPYGGSARAVGDPGLQFARRVSRHEGRDLQRPRSCQ